MPGRRSGERLSADDEADVEKDRQDRHQRHHGQQQRRQAEETDSAMTTPVASE